MLTWLSDRFAQIESFLHLPDLLFSNWSALFRILLTTIVLYFALVIFMKLFGSRSVSSFSVYDMIATITIGSVVSSTMLMKEVNLLNGITGVLALLLLQFFLSRIVGKWEKLYPLTNPSPKVVFLEGEYLTENMQKTRVNKEEILSAIRREAGTTSDQIYAVMLEANGDLSVIQEVTPGYEEEVTKYL